MIKFVNKYKNHLNVKKDKKQSQVNLCLNDYRIQKELLSMQFIAKSPESILNHFRQTISKVSQNVDMLHQKFMNQIGVGQYGKDKMLIKIQSLVAAYETIILDIGVSCQEVEMGDLGNFFIKMHLQHVEIIKWLILNITPQKIVVPEKGLNEEEIQYLETKILERNTNHFYKIKENSMFMSEGITKQIQLLSKQLQSNDKIYENQFRRIANTREKVQKIEASKSYNILLQALQVISYHSDVFKRLANTNKKYVNENIKTLEVKPYAKLRSQVDDAMRQKVKIVMDKVSGTIHRYLQDKDGLIDQYKRKTSCQYGVQVNFSNYNQQKLQAQLKLKQQKLRETMVNMNFNKIRADKLQQLIKEKANYYQERLAKVRLDTSKRSQYEILKKSVTELNSFSKIKESIDGSQAVSIARNSIEDGVIFDYDVFSNQDRKMKKVVQFKKMPQQTPKRGNLKKQKSIVNDENYNKSLLRIQFVSQNLSEQDSRLSIKPNRQFQICQNQIQFNYFGNRAYINKHSVTEVKKLSFCKSIYECSVPITGKRGHGGRGLSFLTIKNVKKNQDSQKQESTISNQISKEEYSIKQPIIKRNKRKQLTQQFNGYPDQFEETPQAMIQFNKIITFHDNREMLPFKFRQIQQRQSESLRASQNQKKTLIKRSSKECNITTAFEALNFQQCANDIENSRRFHGAVTSLKKKRVMKSFHPTQVLKTQQSISNIHHFDKSIVMDLYTNQQNAMQAELEYSVSTSSLICSRKVIRNNILPKAQKNKTIQDEYEQMSKKILKSLYFERKKSLNTFLQIHCMIKFPFSFVKGNFMLKKQQLKQDLSIKQITNFLRFVAKMHNNCPQKPCSHLKQFLQKMGLRTQ